MIQRILLNTLMIRMIFIKILKNITHIKSKKKKKKGKVFIVFDDMIADIFSNKKLNYLLEEEN